MTDDIRNLMAFVPAKDLNVSTRFYQELGFELVWQNEGLRQFRAGRFAFLLQDHYVADWADNFMFSLEVDDVDAWWGFLKPLDLPAKYDGVRWKAPQDYPWGLREIHLIDPAGVLWHIAQPVR